MHCLNKSNSPTVSQRSEPNSGFAKPEAITEAAAIRGFMICSQHPNNGKIWIQLPTAPIRHKIDSGFRS